MLKLKLNINGLGNYVCEQPLIFSNGYEFFSIVLCYIFMVLQSKVVHGSVLLIGNSYGTCYQPLQN